MNAFKPAIELRSILVKLVKEDYFTCSNELSLVETRNLNNKYQTLINSINGFIIICNYITGQYEYVSEGIKNYLGYDLSGFSKEKVTNFVFSIIHESHAKFIVQSLLPTVLTYFKEHATSKTGTDYRYTVCAKLRNVYGNYHWYVIDTVIIEVDANGFPTRTLITCTDIHQFKKDECVYYNILKKNSDGIYEVMLEGTENSQLIECKLTTREIQIINLISQGFLNKQIADKLSITLNTVQSHRKQIMKKTQCKGTAELANFAFARGLA